MVLLKPKIKEYTIIFLVTPCEYKKQQLKKKKKEKKKNQKLKYKEIYNMVQPLADQKLKKQHRMEQHYSNEG